MEFILSGLKLQVEKMAKIKFKRQNSGIKRLKDVWRRPKGRHSKLRRKIKGKGKVPGIGYKKSGNVRFLHPSGKREFYITNLSELEKIIENHKNKLNLIALRLNSRIGKKKRIEILNKAESAGLKILNK